MLYATVKEKSLNGKRVDSIENFDSNIKSFEKALEKELPFTACRTLSGEYFGTGFVAIEFENTWTTDQVMHNEFIKNNASFVIDMGVPDETFIIVIFCLDKPISNIEVHEKILL